MAKLNLTNYHHARTAWQTIYCKQLYGDDRSLQACPEIPNPKGHGWELESDLDQQFLTIDWMTGSPAPEAVLELMSCKCSTGCKLPSCVCILNGLKYTDICRLRGCSKKTPEDCEADISLQHADNILDI